MNRLLRALRHSFYLGRVAHYQRAAARQQQRCGAARLRALQYEALAQQAARRARGYP